MPFRSAILLILLVSFVVSCGQQEVEEDGLVEEVFPKVELKDYDTISVEESFEFIIPNELSLATTQQINGVVAYSNLVSEVHFEVVEFPFQDEVVESEGVDSAFLEFSDKMYEDLISNYESLDLQEQYCSRFNNKMNCYYHVQLRQAGFPKERAISYRFVQGDKGSYLLIFSSLKEDADLYLEMEDAIMLSFKEIKKG